MSHGDALDRKGRRRLAALRRRADHLDRRIAENPDRHEASALRWAIGELEPKNEEKGTGE